MKRVLVAILLLTAACSDNDYVYKSGKDKNGYPHYFQQMPSVEEVYEDCKNAVAKADAGNLKAFYESRCGASTMAMFSSAFLVFDVHPSISQDATAQQKHDAKIQSEAYKSMQKRFCGMFTKNDTKTPLEVQIAKRFISYIDAARIDPKRKEKLEKFLNNRSPFSMTVFYAQKCELDEIQ